jgi:hypothetical protein
MFIEASSIKNPAPEELHVQLDLDLSWQTFRSSGAMAVSKRPFYKHVAPPDR